MKTSAFWLALLASTAALAATSANAAGATQTEPTVDSEEPPLATTADQPVGEAAVSPAVQGPAGSEPAGQTDSGRLEDIVVVAQRRSERLQDVPIAVSALNEKALETARIDNPLALQAAVPGLTFAVQQVSISPFIRGIGNRNTTPGDESAAALYVDGVYTASLAAAFLTLNNVERIEVLKGPQGTLFGRNAAAGVIQIITKQPSHKPSLEASVDYANYNRITGKLYATAGIAPNLAGDIALYGMKQHDGWGKNLFNGKDAFTGNEFAVRSKWVLDLGDTKFSIAGDFDRNVPTLQPAHLPRPGLPLLGGTEYTGFYSLNTNVDVRGRTRQWGGNLQIRHDVGPFQILSISSYRDVDINLHYDQDGTPIPWVNIIFDQTAKTTTQEFQILSPSQSPVQWILGAYFYHDNAAFEPFTAWGRLLGTNVRQRFARQTTKSYAGFGQGTFKLLERTNATVGLRYTTDRRRIEGRDVVNGTLNPASIVEQKAKFSKLTWRFALDHKLDDDKLLYGSISRGFKSGVFAAASPTNPAVRPEVIDAFEVGFKTDWFDRRLRVNAAAFYNKFKDVQIQVPISGANMLINAAKGDIKGAELEIQARPTEQLMLSGNVSLLDGRYTSFPAAPGYIPRPLPLGGNQQITIDASGNDTVQTPPLVAALTAGYTVPTSSGEFDLNGSVTYNDGYYFDPENRTRQKSTVLLGGSLGWTAASERWGVRLWGKNLADEHYYSQIVPQPFGDTSVPDEPRTYGVTLKVKI